MKNKSTDRHNQPIYLRIFNNIYITYIVIGKLLFYNLLPIYYNNMID